MSEVLHLYRYRGSLEFLPIPDKLVELNKQATKPEIILEGEYEVDMDIMEYLTYTSRFYGFGFSYDYCDDITDIMPDDDILRDITRNYTIYSWDGTTYILNKFNIIKENEYKG